MMERYLYKLVVEQDLHGNFLVQFSWFLVIFFFSGLLDSVNCAHQVSAGQW